MFAWAFFDELEKAAGRVATRRMAKTAVVDPGSLARARRGLLAIRKQLAKALNRAPGAVSR